MSKKKGKRATHPQKRHQNNKNSPNDQQEFGDMEAADDMAAFPYTPIQQPKDVLHRNKKGNDFDKRQDVGLSLGVAGIVVAIFSFFVWPFLFAPLSIFLGVLSIKRQVTTGRWAILLGSFTFLLAIIWEPLHILF